MQTTRAIVYLDKFWKNFKMIRERIGPDRHICVPVKADAYGHGAAAIARASLAAGASSLAVAKTEEGAALREAGIDAPVLLFSQPLPVEIPEIIKHRLIPLVSDGEFAAMLDKAAGAAGIRLPVHLKIDTGMGRMGCPFHEAPAVASQIAACTALEYAGTATHLAAADSAAVDDRAYTERQIARFNEALDGIRAAGLNPGIVHAANSGAIILHPGAWFDMVRPGILLYGYKTVEETEAGLTLPPLRVEPVMELRTTVVFVKQVKKGETISYGRTWAAPQDTEIAVLSVGYADGLPRLASNRWQAFIGGKAYPLAGRICMDQCMADLGPASGVRRWDEAVLFGGPAPDAADLARLIGTIPYEITCNINKRVPRVYEEF
ncbi:MAG: alanine racemase [Treponema sp.]|jgi:alanine racemase|nr:alanine racemase [Treponema sp.]